MKLFSIVLLLIILNVESLFSQNRDDSLRITKLVNINLDLLVDSVINMDKHCSYFNDSLCYSIRSRMFKNDKNDTCYYLEFEAKDNINYFIQYYGETDVQYFIKHKKHLLFIKGDVPLLTKSIIDENESIFLKKVNTDNLIESGLDFDSIKNNQVIYINNNFDDLKEDDSWAIRCFIIQDGDFYYYESRNLYRCTK